MDDKASMATDDEAIWRKVDEMHVHISDIRTQQATDRARLDAIEARTERIVEDMADNRAELRHQLNHIGSQLTTLNAHYYRQQGADEANQKASKTRSWLIPAIVSGIVSLVMIAISLGIIKGGGQ